MKIKMILTNGFDPDPRVFKEAKALINDGNDVEILCWDRDNRYLSKSIEYYEGIKIKRFYPKSKYGSGLKQLISYIKFIKEVKHYLEREEYDVIHAHDIDGTFVSIFIKNRAKLVWDMHEFYDGFNYGQLKRWVYELIARICFKNADGIIFVSEYQESRYRKKIKANTTTIVVMNAPEDDLFTNFTNKQSQNLRISFIGSVREYDTLKRLMDVGEKFEHVIINLHGMGAAYNDLKRIEGNYKNTNITGKFKYKDIKKLYENTDIVFAVYNSKLVNVKYAFPVKGLEAIVAGIPIIASKNTLFGDFIEKNDIGFTVDESSESQLENLIKTILNNKELLRVKSENTKMIKKCYRWSEQCHKLIKFYSKFN